MKELGLRPVNEGSVSDCVIGLSFQYIALILAEMTEYIF
jgi:hypothetical protein